MARNLFRESHTGRLSKPALRVGAVYRLMLRGRITSKARAAELLAARGVNPAVLEHWIAHSLKHLAISR